MSTRSSSAIFCTTALLLAQCTSSAPPVDALTTDVVAAENAQDSAPDLLEDTVSNDHTNDSVVLADSSVDASMPMMDASLQENPDVVFPCPAQWVPSAVGGCGPAVLLCADAAPDACAAFDLSRPRPLTDGDGGSNGTAFFRTPDGSIGGGWNADVDAAAPAPDWSPTIAPTQCPEGWRRTSERACEPTLANTCPVGTVPLPDNTCTHTAEDDCGMDEFPPLPPEAAGAMVRYVRAGANSGDGSRTRPFRTLPEGIASAGAGGWVLVARGTYENSFSITAPVHILGRCARYVVLGNVGTLSLTAPLFDLRNVLFDGSITASNTGSITLDRVRIFRGSITIGSNRTATLNEVYGTFGSLLVSSGTTATVTRSVLDGVLSSGNRTQLTLTNSVVRTSDAIARAGGTLQLRDSVLLGSGLRAENNGIAQVQNSAAIDAPLVALSSEGANAQLTVQDSIVRGTRTQPNTITDGRALSATLGATLTASRVLISDGQGYGVFARNANTRITLDSVIVRNTTPAQPLGRPSETPDAATTDATSDALVPGSTSTGSVAGALRAEAGASITGTSVLLTNNSVAAVAVLHEGSVVSLTASALNNTRARDFDQQGGSGVEVSLGAQFLGTRVLLHNNVGVGILASGSARSMPSRVVLQDSIVRDTQPRRSDGSLGIALMASYGASIEGSQLLLTDNRMAGVYATEAGTRVQLRDSAIRNTLARSDGSFGSGVELARGALFQGQRLLLENNTEFGISVFQQGTTAELSQVLLLGVTPSRMGFGLGVAVYGGAQLTASALAIDHVRGAGLASVPYESAVTGRNVGSFLRANGVFVRNVMPGTVRFNTPGDASSERLVSYGVHVGTDCVLQAQEFLVENATYGFFHSAGTMLLRRGVFARQQTFGAANGVDEQHPLLLEDIARVATERNEVLNNIDIPAASIERPTQPNIVLPGE